MLGAILAAAMFLQVPLDLPNSIPTSHEEDAAEVIDFYGGVYEGDGFFFLLDKSGSMRRGRLATLKEELRSAVNSLSHRSEIGAVAFSHDLSYFELVSGRATADRKGRCKEWAEGLTAFGSTKMLSGARAILKIAHRSRQRQRLVILVSDGLPSHPSAGRTLDGILAANREDIPWNTIYIVNTDVGTGTATEFMQALATKTGGTYRIVHD